ncbi:MAG: carboxynorspermidine decarboxylase [Desulfovibrionaceae bacterium]|nr:carboxynorspermidine decarboxylase [Desulfovibrionaceae bacterium]
MAHENILLGASVPSPCFVVDMDRLRRNAAILASVQERTGARILLALKGYACWKTFDILSRAAAGPLWGTCASSVDEARLGREEFGGEVHAFAAAWTEEEMRELATIADSLTFNSVRQWRQFRPILEAAGRPIEAGLRINPEHSEGTVPMYDPCSPGSRLGIRRRHLPDGIMDEGLSGLHFHTLCEQNSDAFARTADAVEANFAPFLAKCRWLNVGGGHHITRDDYDLDLLCSRLKALSERWGVQVYVEPGEAVALNAGYLVATVLDITEADMPLVQLDISAACHTPDVLEMPYRPGIVYESGAGLRKAVSAEEGAWRCRLGGKSCLAGDSFGEYGFDGPLAVGQRLIFQDMAIYSMVKTTTFNGLRLPSIGTVDGSGGSDVFTLLHVFGYEDFRSRLA